MAKEREVRRDQWLCMVLGVISATVAFLTIVPVIVSIFALVGTILSVMTVKYVSFAVVILDSVIVAINLKPEYLLFSRLQAWQFIFMGTDIIYVLLLHHLVPDLIGMTMNYLSIII